MAHAAAAAAAAMTLLKAASLPPAVVAVAVAAAAAACGCLWRAALSFWTRRGGVLTIGNRRSCSLISVAYRLAR
jgi:hypothetical protein